MFVGYHVISYLLPLESMIPHIKLVPVPTLRAKFDEW